ncbi:IclR family transcriptional regulator C-terminal domain-containing protein [Streptomyces sp. E11-3]|uniref:IclR family transcriptional regulator domain-containing protein n=1 Tax=Streptomyces sp. E11-3 TaxID=3110112 RepID=UPI0039805D94
MERGLAVIRAFTADTPEMTLSDAARATGMDRAAVRRFLLTLTDLGYVTADGRHFRLTPRILELGYAYLSSLTLAQIAAPHLEHLVAEVHESSSVAVLDGEDVVYVSRVPTQRIMTVSISIGTRFPAYATSLGRVLLAHLDDGRLRHYLDTVSPAPLTSRTLTSAKTLAAELERVRAQGWCLVDQELEQGLTAVAAPIRSDSRQVVAAVNLSTHAGRRTPDAIHRELLPPLLATAARIEAELKVTSPGL